MLSNYPPGVSGNEPQITGDWPVDPRAPWEDVSDEDGPVLYNPATEEDLWFHTEVEARAWLLILNGLYALDETSRAVGLDCVEAPEHLFDPPDDDYEEDYPF